MEEIIKVVVRHIKRIAYIHHLDLPLSKEACVMFTWRKKSFIATF